MKPSELTGAALDWAVSKTFEPGTYWTSFEHLETFKPSTDWAQGGPIIEREGIALRRFLETGWEADRWQFKFAEPTATGPTPLIAAMRCYVASKLGEDVSIPEELT